jgi:hypothetical protein
MNSPRPFTLLLAPFVVVLLACGRAEDFDQRTGATDRPDTMYQRGDDTAAYLMGDTARDTTRWGEPGGARQPGDTAYGDTTEPIREPAPTNGGNSVPDRQS